MTLASGKIITPNQIVLSNGSWMRKLLPVPITPHKGQSFSLRSPLNQPPLLQRVLFAQDTYIVPKADGRIIVGATVEVGTYDGRMTPSGMMHCMANALELIPALGTLELEESWAGLRPTTPDKGPILGRTQWNNLVIAGGYWRNGVLLAPKTGQLIGDLVLAAASTEVATAGVTAEKEDNLPLLKEQDEQLLQAFSWDRFIAPGRGKELAANTRYAASMHPVQTRSSGVGVAAAVGTELGFYSTAASATEERKRDRELLNMSMGDRNENSLSSSDGNMRMSSADEDAFEKAATLGLEDAAYFDYSLTDEEDEGKTKMDASLNNESDLSTFIESGPQEIPTTTINPSIDSVAKQPISKSSSSSNLQSIYII